MAPADIAYVRHEFRPFDEVCAAADAVPAAMAALVAGGVLPQPCYVLADGGWWVPADYLGLVGSAGGAAGLRAHFEGRYAIAADVHGALAGPDELDEQWDAYLGGWYGVLYRVPEPETAVRAARLQASLARMLAAPEADSWRWRDRVGARVDALDAIYRPGCDIDREQLGGELPRDRWVAAVIEQYGVLRGPPPA